MESDKRKYRKKVKRRLKKLIPTSLELIQGNVSSSNEMSLKQFYENLVLINFTN